MKRIRVLGLCLTAVFAIGAAAAAGASAAPPEFLHVVPVKPGEDITFAATGTAATIENEEPAKLKIKCKSSLASGAIDGPQQMTLDITFNGCKQGMTKCGTGGTGEEIKNFEPLVGTLGYLASGATPGVAFVVRAEENWIVTTCGATGVVIEGGVVAPITLDEKLVTTLKLTYVETNGKQQFERLFGGSLDILKDAFLSKPQTGLKTTITLTLSEPIEVS